MTADATPDAPKAFLRAKDFQAMLPVSERTFWRMLKAGQLPPHKKLGRVILFSRADIEAWSGRSAA
ncbi:MAG: helix-turn-helix domain-containing protein [Alphaproteobacteria bacterium]|nr:helix-turn-helix domain-containing protein [Alphaproteobacteria bacterium]